MKYGLPRQREEIPRGCPALILFFVLLFGFAVLNLFWAQADHLGAGKPPLAQMPRFFVQGPAGRQLDGLFW